MSFNLIQRLDASPNGMPSNPMGDDLLLSSRLMGFGAEFDLGFMGRSEYPMNSTKSAYRILENAPDLAVVVRELIRPDQAVETIHVVCTDEQAETTVEEWQSWAERYSRGAEAPTGFFKDVEGDQYEIHKERTVGWWALKEDIIWARDEAVANNVVYTFQNTYNTVLEAAQGDGNETA